MGIISECAPICTVARCVGTVGDYNIITEIRSVVLLQCIEYIVHRRVPLRRRQYSYVGRWQSNREPRSTIVAFTVYNIAVAYTGRGVSAIVRIRWKSLTRQRVSHVIILITVIILCTRRCWA